VEVVMILGPIRAVVVETNKVVRVPLGALEAETVEGRSFAVRQ